MTKFENVLVCVNAVMPADDLDRAISRGFNKALIDHNFVDLDRGAAAQSNSEIVELCVDRLKLSPQNKSRLVQAVAQAFELGATGVVVRAISDLKAGFYIGDLVACHGCGLKRQVELYMVSSRRSGGIPSGWRVNDTPLESFLNNSVATLSTDVVCVDPRINGAISLLKQTGLAHLCLHSSLRTLCPAEIQLLRLVRLKLSSPRSSLVLLPDLFNDIDPNIATSLTVLLVQLIAEKNTIVISCCYEPPSLLDISHNKIAIGPVDSYREEAGADIYSARSPARLYWIRVEQPGIASRYLKYLGCDEHLDQRKKWNIAVVSDIAPASARIVADILGCTDQLAVFFAALEDARLEGLSSRFFLSQRSDPRIHCQSCRGHGFERRQLENTGEFIPRRCQDCLGRGINAAAESVRFRDKTFSEILDSNLETLLNAYAALMRRRRSLGLACAYGLGKLRANRPMWCLRSSERTALMLAAMPISADDRGATNQRRKIVCSDISSHLATASLERSIKRLAQTFEGPDQIYIISSDQRLEAMVDEVKTACSFDMLDATIMQ